MPWPFRVRLLGQSGGISHGISLYNYCKLANRTPITVGFLVDIYIYMSGYTNSLPIVTIVLESMDGLMTFDDHQLLAINVR